MSLATKATPLPGSKNISLFVEGKVLYLFCDLSKDFGQSASGKTIIIGSSSGNKQLGSSNAFIGLNLFTKSLEKRNLGKDGVAELRTDVFQEVGQGCAWRIEEDGVTLVIEIDFEKTSERPASSGNSFLLASTGGNKVVGKTGIMCGLNCYRPSNASFAVDRIGECGSAGTQLTVGGTVDLENGFSVRYFAEDKATVLFEGTLSDESLAMSPCVLGGTTLALHLGPPKEKRARVEKQSQSTDAASATNGKSQEGVLNSGDEDGKIRNMVVLCDKLDNDVLRLSVTFDPTKSFGRSSSGKSVTVSTSSGFQPIVLNGSMVCRIQFNAYRPAPPLNEETVRDAVFRVLRTKPASNLGDLSFKRVLQEIREELGLREGQEALIKEEAKAAVKTFLEEASQQDKK
ncbi:unnamed protein product [Phytomonas sp. EM1]|nr:unnamed protein product [Phytomonas sp. EM1]|eukprot:CCW62426.1 unnamed protein product [Phytomonas sp. isolate EM1]